MDAPELRDQPEPSRGPPSIGEVVAIGIALLAVLVGAGWWLRTRRASGSTSPYVGDRTCRECHPGESSLHARSGHAHTLRPAAATEVARKLDGITAPDPERPGVSWTFSREADQIHNNAPRG